MIYEIFEEWYHARHFILPALELHHTHTEDDVLVRLATGEYKLWRNDKCAAVTCFIQYPQFKALEVRWGGGDLQALNELRHAIERWAALKGCKEVVSTGREGWGRVLPDYRKCGAIFYREL